MRSSKDWLHYLQTLSSQERDLAKHANVYASQWAHDVRCLRSGVEHRRVGGAITSLGHDEWLQAGFVTRQPLLRK